MGARAEAVRSTQLTEVSSKAKAKVAAAKEVSKEQREQREKEIQNLQSYMDEKQAQAASRRQAANEEKIAKASPTKRGGRCLEPPTALKEPRLSMPRTHPHLH